MSEVARAAEEFGEEIEWVMATSAATGAALFVLREAVVAVLVVNFACFGRGEGVVGFGYLGEFVGGGGVVTVL